MVDAASEGHREARPVPDEPQEGGPVVLRADDISVHFGGNRAVKSVSVTVASGEVVGLIGPNGAGKTTLIDAISGFVEHQGTVEVAGHDVTHRSPHRRARHGLARTWQQVELFSDLSVLDNCRVGAPPTAAGAASVPEARIAEMGVNSIAEMGLDDVADAMPDSLAHGVQKLAGIARALAGAPKVLMLDEPAAGLSIDARAHFSVTVRKIAAAGIGVLLVDHDTSLIFDVCDRLVVMESGSVIATGLPAEVQSDPRVIAAYLGSPGDHHA